MPHRVLRAVLLAKVTECCSAADAEAVVDGLIALGIRLPTVTVIERAALDDIPNGSVVLIGDLRDPTKLPVVGHKADHSIDIAGEEEPWPFHQDGLAPPLPCTVVWVPNEEIDHMVSLAERVVSTPGEVASSALVMEAFAETPREPE